MRSPSSMPRAASARSSTRNGWAGRRACFWPPTTPIAFRRFGPVRVGRALILGARLRLGDDRGATRSAREGERSGVGRGQQQGDREVGAVDGRRPRADGLVRPPAASDRESHPGASGAGAKQANIDVRDALERIRVPTLVMHRPDEHVWDVRHSRYLAEHIPEAPLRRARRRATRSPSSATATRSSKRSRSSSPACAAAASVARALLTVMFTDIVDSTRARRAARRRALARPARAPRRGRAQGARALRRPRGQDDRATASWRRSTGRPRAALRCALAISASGARARRRGPRRHPHRRVRADRRGRRRHGRPHRLARERARRDRARCSSRAPSRHRRRAAPSPSSDRGTHELKGVPGEWPLFALER